jgi:hypothetical protein
MTLAIATAQGRAGQGAPNSSFWCRKMPSDPPPNPPLVRGGAWRSVTLCDGKCPPTHKFPSGIFCFNLFEFW